MITWNFIISVTNVIVQKNWILFGNHLLAHQIKKDFIL